MNDLRSKIDESVRAVRSFTKLRPKVGVILGTGLGGFADRLKQKVKIPYDAIPGLPQSTVVGHAGELVIGKLGKKAIAVMEGRFHYYEGYTMHQVTFPVRMLKALGAHTLVITNASGGLNPLFERGDILVMEDHINLPGLCGIGPLIGPNDDELGPRFVDLGELYTRSLIDRARTVALKADIPTRMGTYVMVAGPQLETRAEYRMLRMLGADAVGMSSVPEAIVAAHSGMKVLGLSCITDMCLPDALAPVEIEHIIEAANTTAPKMAKIVAGVIEGM